MTSLIPSRTSRMRPYFSSDPFGALRDEMNQVFNNFFADGEKGLSEAVASLDVSETDDRYEIDVDLPGLTAEDIQLDVRDRTVTVCGERESEQSEDGRSFHRVERHRGRFCRAIELPGDVDGDNAEAEYKNGILSIRLPKCAGSETHRVSVTAAS